MSSRNTRISAWYVLANFVDPFHEFDSGVFATFFLDKPGPPTGPVLFSDVNSESVTLSWGPPSEDGGNDVTNYSVDFREFGRATWSNYTTCTTKNSIKVTRS